MSSSGRRAHLFRLTAVLVGMGLAAISGAQEIKEFATQGGPALDITAGSDGNLWYTTSNSIGRMSAAGESVEFTLPWEGSPHSITAGPDGNLWFTDGQRVGRCTTSGEITKFVPPGGAAEAIAVGPDGNVWFTEGYNEAFGRITPSGSITEFLLGAPAALVSGPGGYLWFTSGNSIGLLSMAGVVREFPLPADHIPGGLALGPDGNIWFTVPSKDTIGLITPFGDILEFPVTRGSAPRSIVTGPDGNLWFTEPGKDRIGKMSTGGGLFGEFPLPAGSTGPGRITAGPDGNLWFTEASGKIGRITSGQPSGCVPDSTTLCLTGGRFQVRASWLVPSQESFGLGMAIPMGANTGGFWFFDAASVEVVVKVLDGCSQNGRAWVFAGGLTNVGVSLTVTDTQTGATKNYTNPSGTPFQSIQDTAAFPMCP